MTKNLSEERQQKNYELRDKFWSAIGKVNEYVLAHAINPSFMGGPVWPDLRQAFKIIKTENSLIIATDGLSDEFSDSEEANNGFEVELYVEVNDPEFINLTEEELKKTWPFQLLYQAAQNAADSSAYRDAAEEHNVFSTEFYDVNVPANFLNEEKRVGVLIGIESKTVPSKMKLVASDVVLLSITVLNLDELNYILDNYENGRNELVEKLKQVGINNIASVNRKSII